MENATDTSFIRVLLADDHAVVRAGIRQFLEHSGRIQVVAEADNGQKACALIEKHCPDVVVLDIQMPEKSGIEVTTWIREHYPAMGVLILTAYDDEPYVRAVLRAGANGYVMKTSTPEVIAHAVEEIYEGKAVLDSSLTQKLMSSLSSRDDKAPLESMTRRELEVLTLVGKGNTNKAIGFQLNISDRTVQNHLAHIFSKLQAASRTEAVMRAVSLGLLPPDLADTMDD